jgi:hypothetical protein
MRKSIFGLKQASR